MNMGQFRVNTVKLLLKQLLQIGVAADQLFNTLLGLFLLIFTRTIFWADETISAQAYRRKDDSWGWLFSYHLINLLFFWQRWQHCKNAYESELTRLHLPPEYRNT